MRKLLILIVLGVVGFLALRVYQANPRVYSPSEAALKEASSSIASNHGVTAFGNSESARELAKAYSALLKVIAATAFTGGKASALSTSKGEMLVHCQLSGDGCAFLVHVPELRQYRGEVREQLTSLAWQAAQSLVARQPTPPQRLAIGLRGGILYGPIAIGRASGPPASKVDANRALPSELVPFFTVEPTATAPAAAGTTAGPALTP